MKRLVLFGLFGLGITLSAQSAAPPWLAQYKTPATRIITESRLNDFGWRRLAELTDTFGPRLSGSEALEKAIDWAVATMKKDGFDHVRKEPVMVPRWVR